MSGHSLKSLIEVALANRVGALAGLAFNDAALHRLVVATARNITGEQPSKGHQPTHPLYYASVERVLAGGREHQLTYLLAHGFSGEAIYYRAGIPRAKPKTRRARGKGA